MVSGPEALTAEKPPGHRADFIERDVHLCPSGLADVPSIIPIGLRNIENDAIRGPPNLVKEV